MRAAWRLFGFGVTGLAATATYTALVILLVEVLVLSPTLAAILAFVVAMQVSYFGNARWVFADRAIVTGRAALIIRFIGVSGLSFVLNVGGMYAITEYIELGYGWGLVFSCVAVPLLTFMMHNFWTFGSKA